MSSYSEPVAQNTTKPFIDEHLRRNFQYGFRSLGGGYQHLSLIPSYLIDFNTKQTIEGGLGYEMGDKYKIEGAEGEWQEFIRYEGDTAYQYLYNHQTGETRDGGSWSTLIPGTLIDSLDGSKITNLSGMLAGCAVPLSNFYSNITGFVDEDKYSLLQVAVSGGGRCEGGCKLHAVLDNDQIKGVVIPCLTTTKGALFKFNPLDESSKVEFQPHNLDGLVNVAIDGTTIRNGEVGEEYGGADCRAGGKLTSYTYTDDETIEGTGRIGNPVKLKCARPDFIDYTDRGMFKTIPIQDGSFNLIPIGDTSIYRLDGQPLPGTAVNVINGAYEYKFTTPKIDGKPNEEYWWLAEITVTGGTAINVINNAQLELGSALWLYENAKTFPGTITDQFRIAETNDPFTDIPHFVLTGAKRSRSNVNAIVRTGTVRISEDTYYGDSIGAFYSTTGYALLKPDSEVTSALAVSANFSQDVAYESISVPVFGSNRPLNFWFNNATVNILYRGVVKVTE